ncbi:hypothetical protein Hte_002544 [Hypoxylon texense]
MTRSTPATFRVIIVGAGPVGLYLAHALSRANIDYLVLEQYDSVLRHQGAGVLVYPQTIRQLDQIGLYRKAKDYIEIHTQTDLLARGGQVIKSTGLWSILGERHAYPFLGFSRGQLIALLYENLPEKETRIKTGVAVFDIEARETGFKVHLKDGGMVEGSIVVGVDGVYSKTRQIMLRLARTPPDTCPMTAAYHGIYGRFDTCAGLRPGTLYQSRDSGTVSQLIVGEDRGHFAILRSIPPTTESKRYTTEDRDSFAEELTDNMIGPGVRFKAIWDLTVKETAAMVNQEEGYCDKWYHGRIVLAGDAVHKVTSVTGMGVNMGINSAVVLANELYRSLRSEPDPSTNALQHAFTRYQQIREPEAGRLHTVGRIQIRTVTWETWADWLYDRFVNPWVGVDTLVDLLGKLIKRGQILEYVPFVDLPVQVPWVHVPTSEG